MADQELIQSRRRLAFIAEWYQEEAAIIRPFIICFYSSENAIEVFDQRTKKVFLRRTKMPELSDRDFFVGSKLNIFGRQFDLVEYGDELTKNTLAKYRKKTFMIIKNSILNQVGGILDAFIESKFNINNGLMVQFGASQVKGFLKGKGDAESAVLMNQLLQGPTIGIELIADNAVEKLRSCFDQSEQCTREIMPPALVTLFEREDIRNGVYCAKTEEEALKDSAFFFDSKNGLQMACAIKNTTLAVIKPHCIKEGSLGKILAEITANGFKITAMRMNLMERVNCEEFFEVYRTILPEYMSMVAQLASGASMALEITCSDPEKNSYQEFRQFCGPMDPEIAKLLRPHTLRAKFGVNKSMNAVHCTDLPDDTVLELQYLFKILN